MTYLSRQRKAEKINIHRLIKKKNCCSREKAHRKAMAQELEKRWRCAGIREEKRVSFLPLFMMLVCCCSCLQQVGAGNCSKGWDRVGRIAEMEGEELTEVLIPLLLITNNTISYPNVTEVKGWRLSPHVAPLTGDGPGVHALVYEEERDEDEVEAQNATVKRGVVSFRGKRDGELSDACAILIFVDAYQYSSLPPECTTSFNESALDYLSQAISYVSLALLFYPSPNLLISGHSFGGSIAILTGTSLSAATLENVLQAPPLQYDDRLEGTLNDITLQLAPLLHHEGLLEALSLPHDSTLEAPPLPHEDGMQASSEPLQQAPALSPQDDQTSPFPILAFAAVGTRQALCHRGLIIPSTSVVNIAHQWDEVVRINWSDAVGLLCLYEADMPAPCEACFASEGPPTEPHTLAPSQSKDCSRPDEPQPAALPPPASTDCVNCALQTHLPTHLMPFVEKCMRPICNLMPQG
eukprot:c24597_g1_i1 orf=3-1400(+)